MTIRQFCSLPQAAPMLGVCYLTVYRWVRSGKLKSEWAWGRHLIPIEELRPFAIKKCSTCYHEKTENSTRTCACREIEDMKDGCEDWVWRWD